MRVFWAKITLHTLKEIECYLLGIVQIYMAWGFQKSYYTSSMLIGLQNCDLWKFEVWKNGAVQARVESDLLLI